MSISSYLPHEPLRVFVLFSGNTTAIEWLHRMDKWYHHLYKIVGALTNKKKALGIKFFGTHTINADNTNYKKNVGKDETTPKETIPYEILDWGTFLCRDPENKREEYFEAVLEILEKYSFDIIVCSGFHLRIPDFFIEHFLSRGVVIINTHPADLTVVDAITGKRVFVGLWNKAIQATLDAGQTQSCSTAHYISAGTYIDGGPIIAQSKKFKLIPGESPDDVLNRIRRIGSDGEALAMALETICTERNHKSIYIKKNWFIRLIKTLFS